MDWNWLSDPNAWVALATLTVLEIVLGVDNIVFISVLTSRLPEEQQARGRTIGLALALLGRVVLLLSLSWVLGLTAPLLSLLGREVSGRDLILFGGGLFLLTKATHEIHTSLEGPKGGGQEPRTVTFRSALIQILILDLVFSLDSVITAVGMAEDLPVMIAAVVIAIVVMMATARAISEVIERHPTIKMLALSFLMLVGVALIAESLHKEIPRGYIYFAMGFSVLVEMLNLRMKRVTFQDLRKPRQQP